MIYVTGDIHGSIDIRKLLDNEVTEMIKEGDYLLICGDFGLIWHFRREIGKERKWLKWLNSRPWTTIFVDGNHECFPRLNAFPVKEWHGGKVNEIRPKVLHLMRGEIFDIEGYKIFAMGGAASHDRGPVVGDTKAVIGRSWWPEEIPSEEERAYALENLKKHDNKVDYIITHCMPTTYQEIVKQGRYAADPITDFHETVYNTVEFKRWYCGHYHYDMDVNDKLTIVFSRVMPIGQTIAESATILGIPKFRRGENVLFNYNGDKILGKIKDIYPWGAFFKHDAPYYDIMLFDENVKKPVQVKETDIIERSLTSSN